MNSNVRYVGLDVHKRVVEACFLDAAGKVLDRYRFDLDRESLLHFAKTRLTAHDHVALEATTNCWVVARFLTPFVAEVVVSNPLVTKAIAEAKVKTDKVDALVLAQLLRCDFLPRVWQPDAATSLLRELTSRRTSLVQDRTVVRNRVHSLLAVRLLTVPCDELFGKAGRAWLAGLGEDQLGAQGRLLLDTDLRLHDALEAEIEHLDDELARRGYSDARVKLLMTLPGVNVTVAETLLAALGDISRFRDGDHAASYLGLVPRTRQSADRSYHGPITKAGNSHGRWCMVQAAHHVARHPGPLGHFFKKLSKRKNYNVAVVATARKLVVIAWHMLTHNEPYRYAVPQSTAAKLGKLRTRATGERRKSGTPKGEKSVAKYPGGGRTVKSLPRMCREEGLPEPPPLRPGERRMVTDAGLDEFIAGLASDQVIPRRKTARKTAPTGDAPTPTS
jgi:transposase